MHPDTARELKALLLQLLHPASPSALPVAGARRRHVAVGLTPRENGRAGVAVRLEEPADRAMLPELGRAAAAELEVRVIGRVSAPPGPFPRGVADLQRRVRPLRPGVSVAHTAVTAGTLGGFVRIGGRLAIVSNNHVLAAVDKAHLGEAIHQPGPYDGGGPEDRVASLHAVESLRRARRNLVDAAIATLDPHVEAEPGEIPGGPLLATVCPVLEVDPDEPVEKIGRTTGHTTGRVTAVEVDGVAVQYGEVVHLFDDQIEIEGRTGSFSAGGDSGSVIWRSRDRAPLALLFAGSSTGGSRGGGVTFANPLATVLERLGAEWVSG